MLVPWSTRCFSSDTIHHRQHMRGGWIRCCSRHQRHDIDRGSTPPSIDSSPQVISYHSSTEDTPTPMLIRSEIDQMVGQELIKPLSDFRNAAAKSLHDSSPHLSSSGHVCTTPSTARTPNAFPPQQPTASDHRPPPPRRSPPADRPPPSSNHHGEPSAAFCLKSEPPSPGATPRLFPRRPMTVGRPNFTGEPSASGGGISLPCSLGWAVLAEQAEFGCGLSPSAQYSLSISFRFILI
jgi:hypothetical protein